MLRTPFMTITLTAITIGLYFANISLSTMVFDTNSIMSGQIWRVFTGHFMHIDTNHLLWNCIALIILGSMIELRGAKPLLISLAVGLLSVSLLLLSPVASIAIYCGLSGALNSLLVVALWLEWRTERKPLYPLIGMLAALKIVIELATHQSLFTNTSWSPYPPSHLAGYLGGLLSIAAGFARTKKFPASELEMRDSPQIEGSGKK